MTALSAMTVDELAAYDPTKDSDWLLGKVIEYVLAECPEDGSNPVVTFGPWLMTAAIAGLLGLPDHEGERPLDEDRAERRRRIAAWLDENRKRLGL